MLLAEPWHLPYTIRVVAYLTWPLPLVLNLYWFGLALMAAYKMASGGHADHGKTKPE
jgi:hypothetical protein